MCVLRRVRSYKPRSAGQVRILGVKLQRAVLGMFPEGLKPIERRFLNDAVVCVGRARAAIPDDSAGMRNVRSVQKEIPLEIVRSVVNTKCSLLTRVPFK